MKKKKTSYLLMAVCLLLGTAFLVKCTKKSAPEQAVQSIENNAAGNLKTDAVPFVHPGILNTKASLDFVANEVNTGVQPRTDAYNNTVLAYCNSHNPSGNYKAVVTVAGGVTTPDEISFKGDALLSYALALRWAKTGDSQYSTKVKQILDGWANAFQSFAVTGSESRQAHLEASWAAPTFTAAAEIIKNYIPANNVGGGWTSTEDTKFKAFLNNLNQNYIDKVVGDGLNNNWNVSAGYAKMAIGVFEDSQNLYNSGMTIIKNVLPLVIAADGSMNGEICNHNNDCVHFQYSLTGISYAANIATMQGDPSIYTASNSRLLTGYNYQYKLYHGTATPSCGPSSCTPVGAVVWPGIEIADRHYHTAETAYIRDLSDPYGLPGGDMGFLGWTTYTHHGAP